MAISQTAYDTGFVTYTITLTALASGSSRQSDEWENTSLWNDVLVLVKTNGSGAGTGFINVYAFSRVDANRSEGAGASDAAITLQVPPNLTLLGRISMSTAGAVSSQVLSVAAAFGGVLPRYHGIVIENRTSAALSGTAGDHVVKGYGVFQQTA